MLAWAALSAFVFGGVTLLAMVLHPQGKHDPLGVPIALFALISGLAGTGIILWMQGRR